MKRPMTIQDQQMARALLAAAIMIIARETRIYFNSERRPGTRSIPDPTARREIHEMQRWLTQARKAVRS